MSESALTPEESETLRAHGFAVFRGRLITDARPPITAAELAKIEETIGTTVPAGLLELWNVSFGGRLDYALTIPFGEFLYSASFRELFFPGSDGYHDLLGWIEHEQEGYADAAEEAGEPEPDVLPALPFGGFEYLERFYVLTEGPDRGSVLIYAQGLPPAWKGRLNEDTVAPVAAGVAELFEMLELVEDPRTADPESFAAGSETLAKINELREQEPDLAERLLELLVDSVFDWRAMIETSTFAGEAKQHHAARLALVAAAGDNDAALIRDMIRGGYPLDGLVTGNATALSYAIGKGAAEVAEELLDSGCPLGDTTIVFAKRLTPRLLDRLIAAGVTFDIEAALTAGESGAVDTALQIITSGRRHGDWSDVPAAIVRRRQRALDSAAKIESGKLHSYATPAEHREEAEHLSELLRRL